VRNAGNTSQNVTDNNEQLIADEARAS